MGTAPSASAGTVISAANLTVTSAAADRETAPTTVTSAVIMAVAVAGLGAAAAAATVAALTGPRPRGQPTLPTGQPTLPTGHLTTRVGGMVEEIIQNHPVPEMASALVRSKFDAMTDAMC